MIVNNKTEVPDIEVISDDKHKDKMKVFVRKDEVVFECEIDGAGNSFKIPTTLLVQIVLGFDKKTSKITEVMEKMSRDIGNILK